MSPLTLLLLTATPAPLPRPAAVESVVTAPAGADRAAEQIRSLGSIEKAFAHAFSPGEYRGKSPAWVRQRLRVEVVRDGTALRLTLSDCDAADAVAILDALIQEHVLERIPKRKEAMALVLKRLEEERARPRGGPPPLNSPKARAMIQQYLRVLTRSEQEEDAIILLRPCRVRGR